VPVINGVRAAHHVFIIAGVVDGDVCEHQARQKWEKLGDTSVLHWHDSGTPCGSSRHKVYGDIEYVESNPV
jgi:hypothetical protein